MVNWDLFKWVVSGLLGTIVALLSGLILTFQSEITNLDTKVDRAIIAGHANNIELVKAIAILTGKVDILADELRRK